MKVYSNSWLQISLILLPKLKVTPGKRRSCTVSPPASDVATWRLTVRSSRDMTVQALTLLPADTTASADTPVWTLILEDTSRGEPDQGFSISFSVYFSCYNDFIILNQSKKYISHIKDSKLALNIRLKLKN